MHRPTDQPTTHSYLPDYAPSPTPDANLGGDDGTASSPSSSGPLSTGTIVGIVTGSVVAAAGIVGAVFKCLSYRHKKKQASLICHRGGNPAATNTHNQLVQWQPAWQGMPAGALTGNADARATYKRKEFAFAGVRRVKETFELTRQPTPVPTPTPARPASAVLGRGRQPGRIMEEV
ncbi:hypothetical protein A1O7_08919 [Cladophialophora yegresii CBS 114405]|uniref:Uncharacterized protein n=1 Tax=Cladophialophora yegresii CBS 114405 TaxID=1182544 RepID=W9VKG2_9EURO|nr:uncharacterized protein A1O7_08919 [Cladophialophora yegresii CBS 114405]EXJ55988.1 hypothetical protein A1O7_08919 [Cladophialophora yegresii CBS 114405]